MKKTAIFILALILVLILVAACKKKTPEPTVPQPPERVKPAPKTPPAPSQAAKEVKTESETYTYNPKGKRDPFLSIIEASKREKEVEKKKKSLRPSESYDVMDIKVIAIARDRSNFYAMIQLPDNKYFTVKEGMALGLHGGKIVRIDEGKVVVREFIKDYKGEIQSKDTVLRLRKEEGE